MLNTATLESRASFANYVVKLELIAKACSMQVAVGEREPSGARVYKFRAYDNTRTDEDSESDDGYEGQFHEQGADPFAPPVPSSSTRMLNNLRDFRTEYEMHRQSIESILKLPRSQRNDDRHVSTHDNSGPPQAHTNDAIPIRVVAPRLDVWQRSKSRTSMTKRGSVSAALLLAQPPN